jgi:Ion transport protein.
MSAFHVEYFLNKFNLVDFFIVIVGLLELVIEMAGSSGALPSLEVARSPSAIIYYPQTGTAKRCHWRIYLLLLPWISIGTKTRLLQ